MHIAILGNGISGITAARFIRKMSDHQITVISAETDYFFSRTALMYIYMGHMRFTDTQPYEPWFWEKNRIALRRGWVERVDFSGKQLQFTEGEPLAYDKLIIATGSAPNKFGWPGQDLAGVRGLYSYQDLEYMEAHSDGLKRAVIVGGGLIGIEMAEMFHSRHIPVTFLVREQSYWDAVLPKEESEMVSRHIREHGFDLRLSTELSEIVDDGNGRACAVITNEGERIECGYVGLTAGVHPNIQFLKDGELEIGRGILVDEHLQTNLPDVYAIGDCVQLREPKPGRRPIEAVWYTGRMMGETVAHTLCGQPQAYDPGIWFNSAKFLDIEYQVYGDIPAALPDDTESLYWEHPDGRKSIRINYRKADGAVSGFNLMGVRYRHEVCDKWIAEATPIETVIQQLGLANFDPEFYREHEAAVVAAYNQQSGRNLQLKQKRSLSAALRFLRSKTAL
ncbi:NAD(P)/FAD-dependent oxidoreductase [Flavilitoribacter nigricans]|uniref:FAD-dependent oxidoreductase n=1 Tax=Flavilitoribacter nigricans (strain ATCC 23147 / DSM 23189 / NBRC 102662 / NCIMB 1420 / SS-2) TaxID=1122177 RepID=A0A2D0N829_FLAN2|nr:FAD/NAD(P)-binding oxidoreductase [Flavilitoribacter nigricans]PHN03903.1 FAD-dependent oxidoreductase [Flavilitoribacter nigricans DSM 23189 = NBRC 102662]